MGELKRIYSRKSNISGSFPYMLKQLIETRTKDVSDEESKRLILESLGLLYLTIGSFNELIETDDNNIGLYTRANTFNKDMLFLIDKIPLSDIEKCIAIPDTLINAIDVDTTDPDAMLYFKNFFNENFSKEEVHGMRGPREYEAVGDYIVNMTKQVFDSGLINRYMNGGGYENIKVESMININIEDKIGNPKSLSVDGANTALLTEETVDGKLYSIVYVYNNDAILQKSFILGGTIDRTIKSYAFTMNNGIIVSCNDDGQIEYINTATSKRDYFKYPKGLTKADLEDISVITLSTQSTGNYEIVSDENEILYIAFNTDIPYPVPADATHGSKVIAVPFRANDGGAGFVDVKYHGFNTSPNASHNPILTDQILNMHTLGDDLYIIIYDPLWAGGSVYIIKRRVKDSAGGERLGAELFQTVLAPSGDAHITETTTENRSISQIDLGGAFICGPEGKYLYLGDTTHGSVIVYNLNTFKPAYTLPSLAINENIVPHPEDIAINNTFVFVLDKKSAILYRCADNGNYREPQSDYNVIGMPYTNLHNPKLNERRASICEYGGRVMFPVYGENVTVKCVDAVTGIIYGVFGSELKWDSAYPFSSKAFTSAIPGGPDVNAVDAYGDLIAVGRPDKLHILRNNGGTIETVKTFDTNDIKSVTVYKDSVIAIAGATYYHYRNGVLETFANEEGYTHTTVIKDMVLLVKTGEHGKIVLHRLEAGKLTLTDIATLPFYYDLLHIGSNKKDKFYGILNNFVGDPNPYYCFELISGVNNHIKRPTLIDTKHEYIASAKIESLAFGVRADGICDIVGGNGDVRRSSTYPITLDDGADSIVAIRSHSDYIYVLTSSNIIYRLNISDLDVTEYNMNRYNTPTHLPTKANNLGIIDGELFAMTNEGMIGISDITDIEMNLYHPQIAMTQTKVKEVVEAGWEYEVFNPLVRASFYTVAAKNARYEKPTIVKYKKGENHIFVDGERVNMMGINLLGSRLSTVKSGVEQTITAVKVIGVHALSDICIVCCEVTTNTNDRYFSLASIKREINGKWLILNNFAYDNHELITDPDGGDMLGTNVCISGNNARGDGGVEYVTLTLETTTKYHIYDLTLRTSQISAYIPYTKVGAVEKSTETTLIGGQDLGGTNTNGYIKITSDGTVIRYDKDGNEQIRRTFSPFIYHKLYCVDWKTQNNNKYGDILVVATSDVSGVKLLYINVRNMKILTNGGELVNYGALDNPRVSFHGSAWNEYNQPMKDAVLVYGSADGDPIFINTPMASPIFARQWGAENPVEEEDALMKNAIVATSCRKNRYMLTALIYESKNTNFMLDRVVSAKDAGNINGPLALLRYNEKMYALNNTKLVWARQSDFLTDELPFADVKQMRTSEDYDQIGPNITLSEVIMACDGNELFILSKDTGKLIICNADTLAFKRSLTLVDGDNCSAMAVSNGYLVVGDTSKFIVYSKAGVKIHEHVQDSPVVNTVTQTYHDNSFIVERENRLSIVNVVADDRIVDSRSFEIDSLEHYPAILLGDKYIHLNDKGLNIISVHSMQSPILELDHVESFLPIYTEDDDFLFASPYDFEKSETEIFNAMRETSIIRQDGVYRNIISSLDEFDVKYVKVSDIAFDKKCVNEHALHRIEGSFLRKYVINGDYLSKSEAFKPRMTFESLVAVKDHGEYTAVVGRHVSDDIVTVFAKNGDPVFTKYVTGKGTNAVAYDPKRKAVAYTGDKLTVETLDGITVDTPLSADSILDIEFGEKGKLYVLLNTHRIMIYNVDYVNGYLYADTQFSIKPGTNTTRLSYRNGRLIGYGKTIVEFRLNDAVLHANPTRLMYPNLGWPDDYDHIIAYDFPKNGFREYKSIYANKVGRINNYVNHEKFYYDTAIPHGYKSPVKTSEQQRYIGDDEMILLHRTGDALIQDKKSDTCIHDKIHVYDGFERATFNDGVLSYPSGKMIVMSDIDKEPGASYVLESHASDIGDYSAVQIDDDEAAVVSVDGTLSTYKKKGISLDSPVGVVEGYDEIEGVEVTDLGVATEAIRMKELAIEAHTTSKEGVIFFVGTNYKLYRKFEEGEPVEVFDFSHIYDREFTLGYTSIKLGCTAEHLLAWDKDTGSIHVFSMDGNYQYDFKDTFYNIENASFEYNIDDFFTVRNGFVTRDGDTLRVYMYDKDDTTNKNFRPAKDNRLFASTRWNTTSDAADAWNLTAVDAYVNVGIVVMYTANKVIVLDKKTRQVIKQEQLSLIGRDRKFKGIFELMGQTILYSDNSICRFDPRKGYQKELKGLQKEQITNIKCCVAHNNTNGIIIVKDNDDTIYRAYMETDGDLDGEWKIEPLMRKGYPVEMKIDNIFSLTPGVVAVQNENMIRLHEENDLSFYIPGDSEVKCSITDGRFLKKVIGDDDGIFFIFEDGIDFYTNDLNKEATYVESGSELHQANHLTACAFKLDGALYYCDRSEPEVPFLKGVFVHDSGGFTRKRNVTIPSTARKDKMFATVDSVGYLSNTNKVHILDIIGYSFTQIGTIPDSVSVGDVKSLGASEEEIVFLISDSSMIFADRGNLTKFRRTNSIIDQSGKSLDLTDGDVEPVSSGGTDPSVVIRFSDTVFHAKIKDRSDIVLRAVNMEAANISLLHDIYMFSTMFEDTKMHVFVTDILKNSILELELDGLGHMIPVRRFGSYFPMYTVSAYYEQLACYQPKGYSRWFVVARSATKGALYRFDNINHLPEILYDFYTDRVEDPSWKDGNLPSQSRAKMQVNDNHIILNDSGNLHFNVEIAESYSPKKLNETEIGTEFFNKQINSRYRLCNRSIEKFDDQTNHNSETMHPFGDTPDDMSDLNSANGSTISGFDTNGRYDVYLIRDTNKLYIIDKVTKRYVKDITLEHHNADNELNPRKIYLDGDRIICSVKRKGSTSKKCILIYSLDDGSLINSLDRPAGIDDDSVVADPQLVVTKSKIFIGFKTNKEGADIPAVCVYNKADHKLIGTYTWKDLGYPLSSAVDIVAGSYYAQDESVLFVNKGSRGFFDGLANDLPADPLPDSVRTITQEGEWTKVAQNGSGTPGRVRWVIDPAHTGKVSGRIVIKKGQSGSNRTQFAVQTAGTGSNDNSDLSIVWNEKRIVCDMDHEGFDYLGYHFITDDIVEITFISHLQKDKDPTLKWSQFTLYTGVWDEDNASNYVYFKDLELHLTDVTKPALMEVHQFDAETGSYQGTANNVYINGVTNSATDTHLTIGHNRSQILATQDNYGHVVKSKNGNTASAFPADGVVHKVASEYIAHPVFDGDSVIYVPINPRYSLADNFKMPRVGRLLEYRAGYTTGLLKKGIDNLLPADEVATYGTGSDWTVLPAKTAMSEENLYVLYNQNTNTVRTADGKEIKIPDGDYFANEVFIIENHYIIITYNRNIIYNYVTGKVFEVSIKDKVGMATQIIAASKRDILLRGNYNTLYHVSLSEANGVDYDKKSSKKLLLDERSLTPKSTKDVMIEDTASEVISDIGDGGEGTGGKRVIAAGNKIYLGEDGYRPHIENDIASNHHIIVKTKHIYVYKERLIEPQTGNAERYRYRVVNRATGETIRVDDKTPARKYDSSDDYLYALTGGNDMNIEIHRLSDGEYINTLSLRAIFGSAAMFCMVDRSSFLEDAPVRSDIKRTKENTSWLLMVNYADGSTAYNAYIDENDAIRTAVPSFTNIKCPTNIWASRANPSFVEKKNFIEDTSRSLSFMCQVNRFCILGMDNRGGVYKFAVNGRLDDQSNRIIASSIREDYFFYNGNGGDAQVPTAKDHGSIFFDPDDHRLYIKGGESSRVDVFDTSLMNVYDLSDTGNTITDDIEDLAARAEDKSSKQHMLLSYLQINNTHVISLIRFTDSSVGDVIRVLNLKTKEIEYEMDATAYHNYGSDPYNLFEHYMRMISDGGFGNNTITPPQPADLEIIGGEVYVFTTQVGTKDGKSSAYIYVYDADTLAFKRCIDINVPSSFNWLGYGHFDGHMFYTIQHMKQLSTENEAIVVAIDMRDGSTKWTRKLNDSVMSHKFGGPVSRAHTYLRSIYGNETDLFVNSTESNEHNAGGYRINKITGEVEEFILTDYDAQFMIQDMASHESRMYADRFIPTMGNLFPRNNADIDNQLRNKAMFGLFDLENMGEISLSNTILHDAETGETKPTNEAYKSSEQPGVIYGDYAIYPFSLKAWFIDTDIKNPGKVIPLMGRDSRIPNRTIFSTPIPNTSRGYYRGHHVCESGAYISEILPGSENHQVYVHHFDRDSKNHLKYNESFTRTIIEDGSDPLQWIGMCEFTVAGTANPLVAVFSRVGRWVVVYNKGDIFGTKVTELSISGKINAIHCNGSEMVVLFKHDSPSDPAKPWVCRVYDVTTGGAYNPLRTFNLDYGTVSTGAEPIYPRYGAPHNTILLNKTLHMIGSSYRVSYDIETGVYEGKSSIYAPGVSNGIFFGSNSNISYSPIEISAGIFTIAQTIGPVMHVSMCRSGGSFQSIEPMPHGESVLWGSDKRVNSFGPNPPSYDNCLGFLDTGDMSKKATPMNNADYDSHGSFFDPYGDELIVYPYKHCADGINAYRPFSSLGDHIKSFKYENVDFLGNDYASWRDLKTPELIYNESGMSVKDDRTGRVFYFDDDSESTIVGDDEVISEYKPISKAIYTGDSGKSIVTLTKV
jgi:hypothetical protein